MLQEDTKDCDDHFDSSPVSGIVSTNRVLNGEPVTNETQPPAKLMDTANSAKTARKSTSETNLCEFDTNDSEELDTHMDTAHSNIEVPAEMSTNKSPTHTVQSNSHTQIYNCPECSFHSRHKGRLLRHQKHHTK